MVKCTDCNNKVGQKTLLVDGICQSCILKKNADEEKSLICELSSEQAAIGTKDFWSGMKKLLDIKFRHFEKQIENNIKKGVMAEIAIVKEENKLLRTDIEGLKDENKEQEEMGA